MVSPSRFPLFEAFLAGLAGVSLATLAWLPPSPYLAPTLSSATVGLSAAWTLWCLWRLDRRLAQWRRWHINPTWVVPSTAVTRQAGVLFGKGFRWQAPHVAALERALLSEGRLPEGHDERGGYPAMQAVGMTEEEDVLVSWQQLTTHVGLIGMTGSGKSRQLEALLAQAIGAG